LEYKIITIFVQLTIFLTQKILTQWES
jgi:hypothetical protein